MVYMFMLSLSIAHFSCLIVRNNHAFATLCVYGRSKLVLFIRLPHCFSFAALVVGRQCTLIGLPH